MWRWFLLVLAVLLTGCQAGSLAELASALEAHHVSHCLYAQVAVAPYGMAQIYARTGDMNCEALWQARWRVDGP